jgi:hypothetical protein
VTLQQTQHKLNHFVASFRTISSIDRGLSIDIHQCKSNHRAAAFAVRGSRQAIEQLTVSKLLLSFAVEVDNCVLARILEARCAGAEVAVATLSCASRPLV